MRQRAGAVFGMTAGGLASLAVVGWLLQVRVGRPITGEAGPIGTFGTPEAMAAGGESGDRHGLQALADGSAFTVQAAQRALDEGRRSEAVRALDAARRATEVGFHAAADGRAPFQLAYRLIEQARHQLQNGNLAAAGQLLRDAGPALGSFTAGRQVDIGPDLSAWVGSTVIDSHGVRIGEVDKFSSPDREPRQARLRLGGWQDFMGFLDLGGREVLVPVDALLFGPTSHVGRAMVALEPSAGR
jgi:hypothetical protein